MDQSIEEYHIDSQIYFWMSGLMFSNIRYKLGYFYQMFDLNVVGAVLVGFFEIN
jgi:hypothetical protein